MIPDIETTKIGKTIFRVLAITLSPDMVRGRGIGPLSRSPYECNPSRAFVSNGRARWSRTTDPMCIRHVL